MTVQPPAPASDHAPAPAAPASAGLIIGSTVDMAGVSRAKAVPAHRLADYVRTGMGASPSWNVFCADDRIAFTPRFSVTGDLRLRIAEADLRNLGDDVSWAPATLYEQDGTAAAVCPRSALRRVEDRLTGCGLSALVGHELEFTLFGATAPAPALATGRWSAYGLGSALTAKEFLENLLAASARAGLSVEQVHAEYAPGQYEMSLTPASPVAAADHLVLGRVLVGETARRHGLAVSFSPVPVHGTTGNGAHQHLSLARDGHPLLSGGPHAHGLTDEGASAVGGIVAHLPELMGVLAGSVLSHLRLQPGMWSGAYACWGLENREAAVRLCAATHGNPRGAHLEVKAVDPSANPYLSSAVLLGAALRGIQDGTPPPPEVRVDPATLSDAERARAGASLLPGRLPGVLGLLRASDLAHEVLGEAILEALLAVRTREYETFGTQDPAATAERLRFVWSA
ncbi:glutamine synthetase [Streptomyces hebeiensis]